MKSNRNTINIFSILMIVLLVCALIPVHSASTSLTIVNASAVPAAFNPDSDSTRITYTLNIVNGSVTAVVAGKDNTPVRVIDGGRQARGPHSIAWDGNNDNSVSVNDGAYTVWLFTNLPNSVVSSLKQGTTSFDNLSAYNPANTTVLVDRAPPVTNLSMIGNQGEDGIYASSPLVHLTAKDNLSGVNRTEYNLDGNGWAVYTADFSIPHGEHTLDYRSIDKAGNVETEQSMPIDVGTGSSNSSGPSVTSTNPDSGSVGVPLNVVIRAAFDRRMDPATINATTFTLEDEQGNPISGRVGYGSEATFTPSKMLEKDMWYTVDISGDVQDANGERMQDDYIWSFTTAAPGAGINNNTSVDELQAKGTIDPGVDAQDRSNISVVGDNNSTQPSATPAAPDTSRLPIVWMAILLLLACILAIPLILRKR